MLMPRYYFAEDFRPFQEYFLSQPHTEKTFRKGGLLWEPGRPYEKIHYILSGAAMHYALHESGRRKIISFHGPGTVFPGYRQNGYRIECTLATQALSDMRVLEFTVPQFAAMFASSPALSRQVVNWYSMYINRFLYETIHQEFNPTCIKLCNLLYLLLMNRPAASGPAIGMTQEELADILGMSRVQVSRELSALRKQGILSTGRGGLTVTSPLKLARLCTSETV